MWPSFMEELLNFSLGGLGSITFYFFLASFTWDLSSLKLNVNEIPIFVFGAQLVI
jgi:hypothetical protein